MQSFKTPNETTCIISHTSPQQRWTKQSDSLLKPRCGKTPLQVKGCKYDQQTIKYHALFPQEECVTWIQDVSSSVSSNRNSLTDFKTHHSTFNIVSHKLLPPNKQHRVYLQTLTDWKTHKHTSCRSNSCSHLSEFESGPSHQLSDWRMGVSVSLSGHQVNCRWIKHWLHFVEELNFKWPLRIQWMYILILGTLGDKTRMVLGFIVYLINYRPVISWSWVIKAGEDGYHKMIPSKYHF